MKDRDKSKEMNKFLSSKKQQKLKIAQCLKNQVNNIFCMFDKNFVFKLRNTQSANLSICSQNSCI